MLGQNYSQCRLLPSAVEGYSPRQFLKVCWCSQEFPKSHAGPLCHERETNRTKSFSGPFKPLRRPSQPLHLGWALNRPPPARRKTIHFYWLLGQVAWRCCSLGVEGRVVRGMGSLAELWVGGAGCTSKGFLRHRAQG